MGLRNTNVTGLHALVGELSNPRSPRYAQYETLESLAAKFGPSAASVAAVKAFFESSGAESIETTLAGDFLRVDIPHARLSAITNATFHVFQHKASGRRVVRTLDDVAWSWDATVAAAVDVVVGVSDFLDAPRERAGLVAMQSKRRGRKLAATSAPEVRRLRGDADRVVAQLVLYCADGSAVLSATGQCDKAAVTSVTVNLYPRSYAAVTATFPISQLTASNDGSEWLFFTPYITVPRVSGSCQCASTVPVLQAARVSLRWCCWWRPLKPVLVCVASAVDTVSLCLCPSPCSLPCSTPLRR